MNAIDQLIKKISAHPHEVITKTYVLKLLGSIESHECEHCIQIPILEMASLRNGLNVTKGGG